VQLVTRFAPSPTGRLHLGHAFSALTAFDAARAAGGRFLLRIEDTDRGRSRAEYEAAIAEDLAWLGVRWETPVRRQSEHMDEYERVLGRLIDRGLVYRCFRTRREVLVSLAHAPHDAEPVFFGAPLAPAEEALRLARGEVFAWRLSIARVREALGARADALSFEDETGVVPVDPGRLGDAVIARKEFPASYHLSSVWDDAQQGVTHVIRGEDLRDSAHLHAVLQSLLDLPHPVYRHHRLVTDEHGKRLAKRDAAATLRALRDAGATPADVRAMLGL
jgi:glutamyl-Q tRNA(Asp) synthetase